jgi:hypothetical protein
MSVILMDVRWLPLISMFLYRSNLICQAQGTKPGPSANESHRSQHGIESKSAPSGGETDFPVGFQAVASKNMHFSTLSGAAGKLKYRQQKLLETHFAPLQNKIPRCNTKIPRCKTKIPRCKIKYHVAK